MRRLFAILALMFLAPMPALAGVAPAVPPPFVSSINGCSAVCLVTAYSSATAFTDMQAADLITSTQSTTAITAAIAAIPSSFDPACPRATPCTVANLLTNAPCNSSRLGLYGAVSDLFNGAGVNTNEVMRCGLTSTTYYWRPQRTDYAISTTSTGGSLSLTCLVSAPTQFVSGTFTSTLNMNLSTTNCWPGAQFNIANNATLGIFGLNITGLIGSTTKALGLGVRATAIYDGSVWNIF